MLQHMAVPHPAAAPSHRELQGSSWLRIATEPGLKLGLTRILNFCGMVVLFLINYSKLSQSVTTSLQAAPEVLMAGLELWEIQNRIWEGTRRAAPSEHH